jgi:hypothetical protein
MKLLFETNGRSSASQLRKEQKSFKYRSQIKGNGKQRRESGKEEHGYSTNFRLLAYPF